MNGAQRGRPICICMTKILEYCYPIGNSIDNEIHSNATTPGYSISNRRMEEEKYTELQLPGANLHSLFHCRKS